MGVGGVRAVPRIMDEVVGVIISGLEGRQAGCLVSLWAGRLECGESGLTYLARGEASQLLSAGTPRSRTVSSRQQVYQVFRVSSPV